MRAGENTLHNYSHVLVRWLLVLAISALVFGSLYALIQAAES